MKFLAIWFICSAALGSLAGLSSYFPLRFYCGGYGLPQRKARVTIAATFFLLALFMGWTQRLVPGPFGEWFSVGLMVCVFLSGITLTSLQLRKKI